jgi:glycosyltransferase involved in cell wall biosynthesis
MSSTPKYINKKLSQKILTLAVSTNTFGGVAAVLSAYRNHFEHFRTIPTFRHRVDSKIVKAWYALQAIVRCFFLLLFDRRIKIVHIHGAAYASFYRKAIFIKIIRFFNRKIIYHQHAGEFQDFYDKSDRKQWIVNTINCCDRLIVLSQSWKTFYAGIGVDECKIIVLNNIVTPPAAIRPREIDGKLHLLYLGEIKEMKGSYDLLNALKANRALFEGKVLLHVGGIVMDGDFEKMIAQSDLAQMVQYEGWVKGEKKVECLSCADVFIIPSYFEGLPITILEAMSYAHPIIASNVGGIPEIVHSHQNGILVEPGNIEQIKNAILFFVENHDKISEYGAHAYQTVQPFFPEAVFAELEKIYRKV